MATRPPLHRSANQVASSAAARLAYDARRLAESETRKLYKTRRWYALRDRQLRAQPLCVFCEREHRVVPAIVCDHVEPHRGDVDRFWRGPFQSLCLNCHNSTKQRSEQGA